MTVTVTLRPLGRGGWAELPAPMEFRKGQIVPMFGREYRVARVVA